MNETQLKTLRNRAIKQAQAPSASMAIVQATLDVLNEEIADMTRIRDGMKGLLKAPKRSYKTRSTGSVATDTKPVWERAHAWLKDHPGSSAHDVAMAVGSTKDSSHSIMIRLQDKGLARRKKSKGRVMFWAK